MTPLSRIAPLALCALAVLPACGGDGGSGSASLTPDQVGAVYQVCSLVFTPEGGSPPPLDIRAAAMEMPAGDPPVLRVGRTVNSFELEYTRKGDILKPRFTGTYSAASDRIALNFASSGSVNDALLLPARLELSFRQSPQALEVSTYHVNHSVSRGDYERLAGQGYPNARDNIVGTLTGRFAVGGC